jgi:putative membrane protein
MRVICFLILLIVVAALVVFTVQNKEDVTLKYLDRSVSCPMSLLIAVVYLLGMVSGWTIVGFLKRSFRRVAERPRN